MEVLNLEVNNTHCIVMYILSQLTHSGEALPYRVYGVDVL